MLPKISVLMSVYNGSSYLHESVETIINQTFTDFEFIIINDGSTDKSESILQKFQKRDKRIQLISRGNKGLTATLNEGLGYAQGQYIARMDADDIAFPDRFAKQVEFLDQNPDYVAVGSRVLLIDPEGLSICPFAQQTSHEEIDNEHMAGHGGSIVHPAVMLRRSAVQRINGYREEMQIAEDFDLFLRLAEIGRLANLPDILLKYRMHPESIGHSHRLEQKRIANLAVMDAHRRRKLAPPTKIDSGGEHQSSLSELHRKWAWWALGAGNVATARKHALLALTKKPVSSQSWKVLACAMRGY
ncbi:MULTISPECIES: glycosyltransferase [unclassified Coleofasciculus]|uniref:glycosyltransferase n=1 Tax=unclassified Coleofasciculus TaxID=2692782 RepID=UPI001D14CE07|nr:MULTISPECIES: glycosyltransferase [unclassified Coleofasciculus]